MAGKPEILSAAFHGKNKILQLEKLFELAASEQLKFSIKKQIETILKSENDFEKPYFSLDGLNIRIRRGYTCSKRWYLHFLENMEPIVRRIVNNNRNNLTDDIDDISDNTVNNDNGNKNISNNDSENFVMKQDYESIDGEKIKKNKYSTLPMILSKNIFLFEIESEERKIKKYLEKFAFLRYLPLTIDLVG